MSPSTARHLIEAEPGKSVVSHGKFASEFLIIVDRIPQVIRDGKHVAYLGRGDLCGEMVLLADTTHGASVIAVSPRKLPTTPERAFRRSRRAERLARTEEGA